MPEVDTVGENYYKPLERAESLGGWLFWTVSLLSIAALVVDRTAYPVIYAIIQIAFVVGVFLFFVQGQALKLYFFPRAEDARRRELLQNSFGVTLTSEETVGYYNNDQTTPLKRLAASTMESAFFTSHISRRMLFWQRATTAGYVCLYFVAVLYRSTDLEFLAVLAQVLFSEDILSRWVRLEWLRNRSEKVFDSLQAMFVAKPAFSRPIAQSQAVDLFSLYETTKSTAAILLSSRLFHKHNVDLTAIWEQTRQKLGL
jgi:hypothetical protein